MLFKVLRQIANTVDRDWYLSYSGAKWTNDTETEVVQLRNNIVELVKGNVNEITGNTVPEEYYILAPSDGRWALAHVLKEKIIDGTYFERNWPGNEQNQSHAQPIILRLLEIRGNPYKLSTRHDPQLKQIKLVVESSSNPMN